jgi:hypothetical protein
LGALTTGGGAKPLLSYCGNGTPLSNTANGGFYDLPDSGFPAMPYSAVWKTWKTPAFSGFAIGSLLPANLPAKP